MISYEYGCFLIHVRWTGALERMKGYGKRERQRYKIILEKKKVTINKQKNKMLKEATHEEMKKRE